MDLLGGIFGFQGEQELGYVWMIPKSSIVILWEHIRLKNISSQYIIKCDSIRDLTGPAGYYSMSGIEHICIKAPW
jgi:hypothetical protein